MWFACHRSTTPVCQHYSVHPEVFKPSLDLPCSVKANDVMSFVVQHQEQQILTFSKYIKVLFTFLYVLFAITSVSFRDELAGKFSVVSLSPSSGITFYVPSRFEA